MADTRQPRRPRVRATQECSRSAEDPQIIDLINTVRSARINLSADLSAAAGAVDEEQLDIARDIIDGDRRELAGFAARARRSLTESPIDLPAPRRTRRTRSRILIALPAVPLVGALAMTAAAAIGASTHHGHDHGAAARPAAVVQTVDNALTPSTRPTAVADSTLQRLEHVVTHNPKAAQVLAVAADLHQQLTRMIQTSHNNPQQLGVVRRLLNLEQQVLEGNDAPGSTVALAASREIAQLLRVAPDAQSTASRPRAAPTTNTTPPTATMTHSTPTASTSTMPPTSTTAAPKHHRHSTSTPSHHPTNKPRKWHNPLEFPGVFSAVL